MGIEFVEMMKQIILELQCRRGVGHTKYGIEFARRIAAIYVVADSRQASELKSKDPDLQITTLLGLARGEMRGDHSPIIFDTHAIECFIGDFLALYFALQKENTQLEARLINDLNNTNRSTFSPKVGSSWLSMDEAEELQRYLNGKK